MNNSELREDLLDVVNSSKTTLEITINKVYLCPTDKSAYSHKRCKYLGMYKDRSVLGIAEIDAVIDVLSETQTEVCWINNGEDEDTLTARAVEKAVKLQGDKLPRRVFLLSNLKKCDFIKDSPGGLQGSKLYFNIGELAATDSTDLAQKLTGRKWSEFGSL